MGEGEEVVGVEGAGCEVDGEVGRDGVEAAGGDDDGAGFGGEVVESRSELSVSNIFGRDKTRTVR